MGAGNECASKVCEVRNREGRGRVGEGVESDSAFLLEERAWRRVGYTGELMEKHCAGGLLRVHGKDGVTAKCISDRVHGAGEAGAVVTAALERVGAKDASGDGAKLRDAEMGTGGAVIITAFGDLVHETRSKARIGRGEGAGEERQLVVGDDVGIVLHKCRVTWRQACQCRTRLRYGLALVGSEVAPAPGAHPERESRGILRSIERCCFSCRSFPLLQTFAVRSYVRRTRERRGCRRRGEPSGFSSAR